MSYDRTYKQTNRDYCFIFIDVLIMWNNGVTKLKYSFRYVSSGLYYVVLA